MHSFFSHHTLILRQSLALALAETDRVGRISRRHEVSFAALLAHGVKAWYDDRSGGSVGRAGREDGFGYAGVIQCGCIARQDLLMSGGC